MSDTISTVADLLRRKEPHPTISKNIIHTPELLTPNEPLPRVPIDPPEEYVHVMTKERCKYIKDILSRNNIEVPRVQISPPPTKLIHNVHTPKERFQKIKPVTAPTQTMFGNLAARALLAQEVFKNTINHIFNAHGKMKHYIHYDEAQIQIYGIRH